MQKAYISKQLTQGFEVVSEKIDKQAILIEDIMITKIPSINPSKGPSIDSEQRKQGFPVCKEQQSEDVGIWLLDAAASLAEDARARAGAGPVTAEMRDSEVFEGADYVRMVLLPRYQE